jgi:hypothetical protein
MRLARACTHRIRNARLVLPTCAGLPICFCCRLQLLRSTETDGLGLQSPTAFPTGSLRVRSGYSAAASPARFSLIALGFPSLLAFANRAALAVDDLLPLARGQIPRARSCLAGSWRGCPRRAFVASRLVSCPRPSATQPSGRLGLRHLLSFACLKDRASDPNPEQATAAASSPLPAAQHGVAADESLGRASRSLWPSQLNAGTLGREHFKQETRVSLL